MSLGWLPKDYLVYVAVLTAHFGIFLNGVAISWTSPVLFKLNHLEDNPLKRKITTLEQAWLLSIRVFFSWIGSATAGYLAKKFGRKPAFAIMIIPEVVSYSILCRAESISLIILARAINGLSSGAMFTLNPIYCGEVAEAKNRGRLGGSVLIFLNLGFLFSFCVGPYTQFHQFHMILSAISVLYIVLIITVMPETPYYLIEKNYNKAKKILQDLRGVQNVGSELTKIQDYVDQKKEVSLWDVAKDKAMRKGLLMACGLNFFQQGSGSGVVMSFGQLIFEEVSGFLPSALYPIITGVCQVIFAFIAPAVIDRTGRKILLIVSELGISASLFSFGVYFFLKNQNQTVTSISWLPLAALVLFKFAFCIGIGPAPFIIIGEVFPLKAKGAAVSIASIFGATVHLVETNIYNVLHKQIGIGPSVWILSIIALLGALFVTLYVLETKGKTLQEIQEMINRKETKALTS